MHCAGCKRYVNRYQECVWESSVYMSTYRGRGIDLCEQCGELEDALIENEGTNDLPEVLSTYKNNLKEIDNRL